MKGKVLIALGGNALLQSKEKGTVEEQLAHVEETCQCFIEMIKEKYVIAVTHGNGPQVGAILLQNEIAKEKLPVMPLDICGAESQGMIGYMIQRVLFNYLKKNHKNVPVVTFLTQTLVDKNDPAFSSPTKPIGPFYTKEQSEQLQKEKGWTMVDQIGKGYRRVVPSPQPIDIIEGPVIKELFDEEKIVIACGGGGIPVICDDDGNLVGTEAVIDKDLTAAVLAKKIEADVLMILTDVEKVAINFGKPDQKGLDHLDMKQARVYQESGEFAKGSMGPKVAAACRFIESGGKRAIITSLKKSVEALKGNTGTHFTL